MGDAFDAGIVETVDDDGFPPLLSLLSWLFVWPPRDDDDEDGDGEGAIVDGPVGGDLKVSQSAAACGWLLEMNLQSAGGRLGTGW